MIARRPTARATALAVTLAVALLTTLACDAERDADRDAERSTARPHERHEPIAWATCRQFDVYAADVRAATVTPAEIRPELERLAERAAGAESAEIRDRARALAAAATDARAFASAAARMTDVCREHVLR